MIEKSKLCSKLKIKSALLMIRFSASNIMIPTALFNNYWWNIMSYYRCRSEYKLLKLYFFKSKLLVYTYKYVTVIN